MTDTSTALLELAKDRAVLLAAIKSIIDQTTMVQHSQETRLNDIFDIATSALTQIGAI